MSIKNLLAKARANTYKEKGNGNIDCISCGKHDCYEEIVTYELEGVALEIKRICNNCKEMMDYYVHGYWESEV